MSKADVASLQFDALGTEIELRIVFVGNEEFERAKHDLEKVRLMYENLNKVFSRFDCESELSACNDNLNVFREASDEFFEVACHCLKFHEQTHGFFDPRILSTLKSVGYCKDFKEGNFKLSAEDICNCHERPLGEDLKIKDKQICFSGCMDFSGIAKGFITDKVAGFLKSKGWKNFLVDSGGDMFLCGHDQDGNAWRIDLDGVPYQKLMFELSEKGLATSGISKRKWEIDGQKFHHLINPKKPRQFLFDLKTVTVIADTTEQSDLWAKTLFVMGKENAMIYARENNMAAVVLDYHGNAWISPKIKDFLYNN